MESHWMFVKCSRALARAGIASLRFDFYGSGESEGEFAEMSLQSEVADALAGVDFLRRQRGIDPRRMGMVGMSLGGAIAALIAQRARVQALVMWSAPAHLEELAALATQAASPIPGRHNLVDYKGHKVCTDALKEIDRFDPLRQIASFSQPTLLIHPESDLYVPTFHAEHYLESAGAVIKQLVIIHNADHTFSSLDWEQEVIDRTVGWLATYLS
jgi:dipeptidyl aminopeptidase/acylaminoacyl peptidase